MAELCVWEEGGVGLNGWVGGGVCCVGVGWFWYFQNFMSFFLILIVVMGFGLSLGCFIDLFIKYEGITHP